MLTNGSAGGRGTLTLRRRVLCEVSSAPALEFARGGAGERSINRYLSYFVCISDKILLIAWYLAGSYPNPACFFGGHGLSHFSPSGSRPACYVDLIVGILAPADEIEIDRGGRTLAFATCCSNQIGHPNDARWFYFRLINTLGSDGGWIDDHGQFEKSDSCTPTFIIVPSSRLGPSLATRQPGWPFWRQNLYTVCSQCDDGRD